MISIIVAVANNWAIGKDNKLLCHLPADLKRFKQITLGHKVIMGKNTYLSLPVRPLTNRLNIVLTDDANEKFENCVTVYSIKEILEICKFEEENFIMGGASVYKQFMPLADKLYLTKIHADFEADTFFPEVKATEWQLIEQKDNEKDEKNPFDYSFLTYQRIKT